MKEAFEKIKERLTGTESVKLYGSKNSGNYLLPLEDALSIVSEVEAEYGNGWIPVEERLPEDGVNVLVWFEYFRYGEYNRLYQTHGISYTFEGKWSGFVNGSSGWRELRIIAWMPLPEPYRADNEAELPFSDTEESEVEE